MTQKHKIGTEPICIGSRIRNRRLELGLSQQDLAYRFGMGQGSISKMERGIGCNDRAMIILSVLINMDYKRDA